jgi:hypothetical protein
MTLTPLHLVSGEAQSRIGTVRGSPLSDFAQIPIQAPSPLVTSVRPPADERRILRRVRPGLDDEAT